MISGNPEIDNRIRSIWDERIISPTEVISRCGELLLEQADALTTIQLIRLNTAKAVALAAVNRIEDAVEAASAAERLLDNRPAEDHQITFELRRIRGRQALLASREAEGLKLTLKNIDEAAASGDERLIALSHSDAAAAYGVAGNLRKAIEHLQQSLQRTPESNSGHYGALLNNLGNVYLLLQRREEAIACFVQARDAFSKVGNDLQLAITLSNEARALDGLGEFDRAIALQRESIERFKQGGYGHYVSAGNYKLANTLSKSGHHAEAEEYYLASLKCTENPNSSAYEDDARQAYGEFLMSQNRSAEAVTQFRRCVEISQAGATYTRIATYLELLITAQEASGQSDAALATIKQLVEVRDKMDHDPARSSSQTEVIELEQSLERELELVRVTASALVEANRRLADQSRELSELATTDHLTALRNRRYFTQKLEAALWGLRKSDSGFSVIFLDVDSFKQVNDRFGHEAGDLVLQELARILRSSVRESDVVARWGGEEFALLLGGANSDAAVGIAAKLHQSVANFDWGVLAPDLSVTISAGVISSDDYPHASADDLMRIADQLLYSAKLGGRNRTVQATTNPNAGAAV